MRAWPWLIGGGIAAFAWSRRGRHGTAPGDSPSAVPPALFAGPLPGRWVWPVPRWNGRAPVISDGFYSPRPGLPRHGGVDIMFVRVPADQFQVGSPNGTRQFVMPDGLVAVAASDGTVWSADSMPTGFAVVLDHTPTKAATFYAHLEKLLVKPTSRGKSGERVRAGQPIGVIGASPLDGEHLKHLHFELWLGGPSDRVDPSLAMRTWDIVLDPNAATGVLVARNALMVYRPIGARGEPYPDWIRALKGKAGVYLIRDRETRELLYIGSSAGRLYDTVTRHLQQVRHEAKEIPMT